MLVRKRWAGKGAANMIHGIYPERRPSMIERYRLKRVCRVMSRVFPDVMKKVDCFFVFRESAQTEKGYVGWNCWQKQPDTGLTFCAVGILDHCLNEKMTDTVNNERQYLYSTFIHELAHVTPQDGHEFTFVDREREMLARFNEAMREDIVFTETVWPGSGRVDPWLEKGGSTIQGG